MFSTLPRTTQTLGRAGAARRGSVLLMVVAVLALMAIIAVAYTTLGRADRAASASLVRASRLDDQSAFIRDYLAGVIADDVLSTYAEQDGDGRPILRREATDVPGASDWLTSDQTLLNTGAMRFRPTGAYAGPWSGGRADARRPSDPWLATIEPEYIPQAGASITPGAFDMSDLDDWRTLRAISNFSPDGRFVNRVNLRGNFNAAPGFSNGAPWRMSSRLSLLDANDNPTDDNLITGFSIDPSNRLPADFSTLQFRAFRPMFDNRQPDDPDHIHNQWADADGDGFADSRWWELVDAFDQDAPSWILPQFGRARMLIAARAIDLSGLVNVNVASDFLYEPRARLNASNQLVHYPAGLTPADVDLRRLLRMGDLNWVLRDGADSYGYNAFEQVNGSVADYTGYDRNLAIDIGKTSYAAIRHAINTGETLPGNARRTGSPSDPNLQWNASEASPNPNNPNPLTDDLRARFYEEFGSDPSSARSRAPNTSFVYRAPFGLADELELRTFSGINDSDHLSPLELVTGGREDQRFGPMRENRPRAVEMQGRPDSASGDASDAALLGVFADIRHLLTTQSGARHIIDNPAVSVNPSVLNTGEFKVDAITLLRALDKSSGVDPTIENIRILFNAYADALAPYTNETQYAYAWDRSNVRSRGLSYGESAELAVRAAAHLAVNAMDAVDVETVTVGGQTYDRAEPTRLQLEVVSGAPTDPGFEQTLIVGLDDARRPAAAEGLHGGSPRLNVFGIEAQPFVIEVAWYGMYTDTPHEATVPGDDDYTDNQTAPVPPETEPTLGNITIDQTPDPDNQDFLFEVIAFQLTNPFDRDLVISAAGDVRYYIEYSNRFFALAERNADGSGISTSDIILEAYETRVFYVCNIRNPADVTRRLQNAVYPVSGGPTIAADFLESWAQTQFGSDAIAIPMVHRTTLAVCPGSNDTFNGSPMPFADIFAEDTVAAGAGGEPQQQAIGPAAGSSQSQRKVAYLWRRPADAGAVSDRDILLDRIRDPSTDPDGEIFSLRSGTTNHEIPGTEAGNDTDGNAGNDEDNTGYSISRWAAFGRPTDTEYRRGSMPAWTLEAKNDNLTTLPIDRLRNQALDGPPGDFGSDGDYTGTDSARRTTLSSLVAAQTSNAIPYKRMIESAQEKGGNQVQANRSGFPFIDAAVQIHLSGGGSNPQLFARAGDFLLPLAIGPTQDPLRGATIPNRVEQLEAQWMTLSEALALACDYYSPQADDSLIGTGQVNPLYLLGHSGALTANRPRLDRAQLSLSDFAPYIDVDGNGTFGVGTDEPLGRGVPMAYNVVDMFNTTDRWRLNNSGQLVLRDRAHGSLRSRIHGLININTAPPSVLRMIPMFAPDVDVESWLRSPTNTVFDPASMIFDIAATAAAYRDKTTLTTRPAQAAGTRQVLDFRDDNDGNINTTDGRFRATRIAAIREQPGFKSPGEVLALRYHNPASATPARLYENSIDRFADKTSLKQIKTGLESTLIPDVAGTGYETDDLPNDYDEQLAIANAAINSISVRSDVFCVWFLIHGYLPSDVENLGPLDPMIPSIARRYVMVVDRSNVVQLGQKPNILLFQEVPIR
jgi:hypothetical protein